MNPWIAHVKAYASEQKISYGQALKDAKATYKAKSPQTEAKAPQTEEPKPESVPTKPKAARKTRKPTTTVTTTTVTTATTRKKAIPSLPEPKDVDIPCM